MGRLHKKRSCALWEVLDPGRGYRRSNVLSSFPSYPEGRLEPKKVKRVRKLSAGGCKAHLSLRSHTGGDLILVVLEEAPIFL